MTPASILYGLPPRELTEPGLAAVQVSPLVPGSSSLEDFEPGSLAEATVYAPPGAVERRYVLALALRSLKAGGRLTAMAPKDKGGSRLKKELHSFGCPVDEDARRHHRICSTTRPADLDGIDAAIDEGSPRQVGPVWTQPGIFSWDRIDPGSIELAEQLPDLSGQGADLGCGYGYLGRVVLKSPAVTRLHLIDIDRRAVSCARRNVEDSRVEFHWADVTQTELSDLDFVVMNPPFHAAGTEDRGLGQAFIRQASKMLRKGGVLYAVANRHLPYERVLAESFSKVDVLSETGGYKVFGATR